MRASHVIGIVLIVVGIVGVVASVGGYGLGAMLPWLIAVALIGVGIAAILGAVSGKPAELPPPPVPPPAAPPPVAPSPVVPSAVPVPDGVPPSAAAPLWGPAAAGPAPGAPPPATYNKGLGDIEMAGPMILGPSRYETFIGEIKLDLTQAVIPEGETAISANTVLGEIRILAPADVGVAARVGTLLGSVEVLGRKGGSVAADEMVVSDDYAAAARRLRIEARTVLGDVAIRRAKPLGWVPPSAPAEPAAPPWAASPEPAPAPPVEPAPAPPVEPAPAPPVEPPRA